MADLEQLKAKYSSVLNSINQSGARLTHVHLQDNKLYIEGGCGSEAIKNKIWDQVKLVDPAYSDLTLNLTVDPSLAPKEQVYTVAAGELTQEGGTLTGARPAGVLHVGTG